MVDSWLENALDIGLTEEQFWEMSIAELERYANSYKRKKMEQAKEKASFDYILAELIGTSVARLFQDGLSFPDISEVYPTLFDGKAVQEEKQTKQMELSALRFEQFANSYNKKWKEANTDNG